MVVSAHDDVKIPEPTAELVLAGTPVFVMSSDWIRSIVADVLQRVLGTCASVISRLLRAARADAQPRLLELRSQSFTG